MTRPVTRRRVTRRRGKALLIRLSDEERDTLRARALGVGCPVARFVREAALGATFVVPEARVSADVLSELRRLALAIAKLREDAAAAQGDAGFVARADAAFAAVLAVAARI